MSTNATHRPWRMSLARSAAFRAVGLSVTGFIGWLWLSSPDGPAWKAVSLVAGLALAALVGIAWYLPRARTERRWLAALDRYAEQQRTKLAFRSVIEGGRRHAAAPPQAAGGRDGVK